ncbi:hypothetical protein GGG16DRAFT_46506 [Schizophyllum commune]
MEAPQWKTSIAHTLSNSPSVANRMLQLSSLDASDPSRPYIRSFFFHSFVSAATCPSHPVLVAPVDMRTPKLAHLLAHSRIRLSWHLPDAGEQYYIAGTVAILPTPQDTLYPHYAFAIRRPEANSGLRALADEGFDWDKLREEVYHSLDARQRKSFASRRLPGSSISVEEAGSSEDSPEVEEHAAQSNMGLVVIDPAEVEVLEMEEWPLTRRTRYWRSRDGIWESELLA